MSRKALILAASLVALLTPFVKVIALSTDHLQFDNSITNPKNLFYLQKAEARALAGEGSYQNALSLLNGMLETVGNITDSVFVLMDEANIEYEMSQKGIGLNNIGRNAWASYNQRLEELQLLLEGSANHPVVPDLDIPQSFQLHDALPNPFNPTTIIGFSLPQMVRVDLAVFDISGRQVAKLVNSWQTSGNHQITFDASNLASGVYFCRIIAGNFCQSKKLVLLK